MGVSRATCTARRGVAHSILYPPGGCVKVEAVKIILPEAWEALIEGKVWGGRYADESDVMREALRALEWREDGDSV